MYTNKPRWWLILDPLLQGTEVRQTRVGAVPVVCWNQTAHLLLSPGFGSRPVGSFGSSGDSMPGMGHTVSGGHGSIPGQNSGLWRVCKPFILSINSQGQNQDAGNDNEMETHFHLFLE